MRLVAADSKKGRYSFSQRRKDLWGRRMHGESRKKAEYQVKREAITSLQRLKGARPFSPQEMQRLRQLVCNPEWRIRCRAL